MRNPATPSITPFGSLLLCIAFTLLSLNTSATHIVGGEMTYRCIGNNQYELSLTVFRDCFNGVPPFDQVASIGIFDANNSLVMDVRIPFIEDDTLQPVLFDSCLVIPPNVCVHRTTYIDTVTLPFMAGGYKILYQRCCRNYTIVNINDPDVTGATFYTFISEDGLTQCNSNPVFQEWPPIYICAGTPIVFDHSAIDADGDSLAYELCAPFVGANINTPQPQPPFAPTYNSLLFPYDTVAWATPYSTSDMMGGIPLAIDPQTGWLTGTPATVGQFVVGICVKEFRNGQLIGITKRDFQYNVGTCASTFNADFDAPSVVCDSLRVDILNNSTGGNYFWNFGDPTSNADTSSMINPSYTYPDTGTYTIQLISGLGDPCADTAIQHVQVLNQSINWDIDVIYDACEDTVTVQFIDQSDVGSSVAVQWDWDFFFTTSNQQNPTITFSGNPTGQYLYRMILTAANGCQGFGFGMINTYPIELDFEIGTQECPGDEIEIAAISLDSTDTISYTWMPEPLILSNPNEAVAVVAPELPTTYILQSQYNTCTRLDTFFIDPTPITPPLDIEADPDSIFPGASSQLFATDDLGYLYEWTLDETLSNNEIYNPVASPLVTTTYALQITDERGCTASDSLTIYLRPFECEMPYIFIPNAFTPNGDGRNDLLYVRANGTAEFYFAVYNRWGQKVFETRDLNTAWDGTFEGRPLAPDVFGYLLEVECVNGETTFQKGNISLLR